MIYFKILQQEKKEKQRKNKGIGASVTKLNGCRFPVESIWVLGLTSSI